MSNYPDNNDILIIDDSIDDIKILSQILSQQGSVRFGFNAADAIHLIKEYTPQILLLDVELPDMDGIGLIKELKKLDQSIKFPILLSTLHHDPLIENQAYGLGAFGIIRKPVNPDTVLFKVDSALHHFDNLPDLSGKKIPVLLISDDITHSAKIAHDLAASSLEIIISRSLDQASKLLSFTHFELIIVDDRLADFSDIGSCKIINQDRLVVLTDTINAQRETDFINQSGCELVYRSVIINLLKAHFAHQLL